jgi:hypothetical protein
MANIINIAPGTASANAVTLGAVYSNMSSSIDWLNPKRQGLLRMLEAFGVKTPGNDGDICYNAATGAVEIRSGNRWIEIATYK